MNQIDLWDKSRKQGKNLLFIVQKYCFTAKLEQLRKNLTFTQILKLIVLSGKI